MFASRLIRNQNQILANDDNICSDVWEGNNDNYDIFDDTAETGDEGLIDGSHQSSSSVQNKTLCNNDDEPLLPE